MPLILKSKTKGWEFYFMFPAIPGDMNATALVNAGWWLVLEALWRNL